jgi:hypothetical protein
MPAVATRLIDNCVLLDSTTGPEAVDFYLVEGVGPDEIFGGTVTGLPAKGDLHPSGVLATLRERARVRTWGMTTHLVKCVYRTVDFGFNIRRGSASSVSIRPFFIPKITQFADGTYFYDPEDNTSRQSYTRVRWQIVESRQNSIQQSQARALIAANIGRWYVVDGAFCVLAGASIRSSVSGSREIDTYFISESAVPAFAPNTFWGQSVALPALAPFSEYTFSMRDNPVVVYATTPSLVYQAGEALPWL